ncbi:MAG: hypothetical protein ACI8XO_001701 [Verrucomicrobiales bacterium]|jgi:hypothetical protein
MRLKLIALLPLVALWSCSAPGVKELTKPIADSKIAQVLVSGDHLTPELRAYLEQKGLDRAYRRSPGDAVRTLSSRLRTRPSDDARTALAQLCAKTGEKLRRTSPEEAIGFYLKAASLSFDDAVATADQSDENPMRIVYNHSSRSASRLLFDAGSLSKSSVTVQGPETVYTVRVNQKRAGMVSPSFVDTLIPADYLEFKGLDDLTRIRHEGVGGRLVGHRKGSAERQVTEPLLHPDSGMSIPLTATLEFGDRGESELVTLSLHDTLLVQEASLGGSRVPLATDLTAPLAIIHNYSERGNVGLKNMMKPLRAKARTGLYLMEPFRSDEIPIIFVHGLKSTPDIWLESLNKLRADPLVRDRFQLLVFSYPSGFPIGVNAATLRKHLHEFRERYDPRGTNPAMRKMVLIGHSMGGILSNYQIRDSEQIVHDKLFDRPLDETNLTDAQKAVFRPVVNFEANPDIGRVIFVASPHGGSDLALGTVGAIGTKIVRLPLKTLILTQQTNTIEGMTEAGHALMKSKLTSVHSLRPDNLGLKTVWELPNPHKVPVHSIIAREKASGSLQESSDGVVAYTSSHVESAASEKVVVGEDHNSVTTSDEAIKELRRILYLHIGRNL